MAKWTALKFDFTTGKYVGGYYDIAEAGIVAVFVDSFFGLDTNAGTAVAPFKTLSKAITVLNASGANGSRIFANGIFSENLPAQTYWYEIIGCGGGSDGRTVFYYDPVANTKIAISNQSFRIHNIRFLNYVTTTTFAPQIRDRSPYMVNCIGANLYFQANHSGEAAAGIFFYTKLNNCRFYNLFQGPSIRIYGANLVLYNCKQPGESQPIILEANNSFANDTLVTSYIGVKNLLNTEAQFINPAQNDFNVRITSPLIGAGIVDEITGIAANVGGVEVGLPYNGISSEFTSQGGAIISNLTIDSLGRYTITPPATSGTLETALMDLGNIYPLENINVLNVFDFLNGVITQGIFETFTGVRPALTIKLKYGLTPAEVTDCPWLLIEYGKKPTYSGTGASRVGNADDTFSITSYLPITARYIKLFITLKNNA
jgi:hypothetical protein